MESLTAADPQVIGEFRLWARLGAGGMGQEMDRAYGGPAHLSDHYALSASALPRTGPEGNS
jgi:hypothetical protein